MEVGDDCFETIAEEQIVFSQPATLTIKEPAYGRDFISVPITITDPDSRPEDLVVDAEVVGETQATVVVVGSPPNEIRVTPLVSEGSILIDAVARDESGNASEVGRFALDVVPPVIEDPGPSVRFGVTAVRREPGESVTLPIEIIDENTLLEDLTIEVMPSNELVITALTALKRLSVCKNPSPFGVSSRNDQAAAAKAQFVRNA